MHCLNYNPFKFVAQSSISPPPLKLHSHISFVVTRKVAPPCLRHTIEAVSYGHGHFIILDAQCLCPQFSDPHFNSYTQVNIHRV